jgi:hypothetical protein
MTEFSFELELESLANLEGVYGLARLDVRYKLSKTHDHAEIDELLIVDLDRAQEVDIETLSIEDRTRVLTTAKSCLRDAFEDLIEQKMNNE